MTMTRQRHTPPAKGHSREEQSIDDMVEDTFPASDATQLPGRAGAPSDQRPPRHVDHDEPAAAEPRTIGNQGVLPATRMHEESVPLGSAGDVRLRFDAQARVVSLQFRDEAVSLDADALDRLIAALSTKRAQMNE
jgi:hypothetical protein